MVFLLQHGVRNRFAPRLHHSTHISARAGLLSMYRHRTLVQEDARPIRISMSRTLVSLLYCVKMKMPHRAHRIGGSESWISVSNLRRITRTIRTYDSYVEFKCRLYNLVNQPTTTSISESQTSAVQSWNLRRKQPYVLTTYKVENLAAYGRNLKRLLPGDSESVHFGH